MKPAADLGSAFNGENPPIKYRKELYKKNIVFYRAEAQMLSSSLLQLPGMYINGCDNLSRAQFLKFFFF